MSVIAAYLESRQSSRHGVYLLLFTAAAAGISLTESLIPVPFWKPGTANIVILLLLVLGESKDALVVTVARTFVVAFFRGGLFGAGHMLSLSGAVLSFVVMALLCMPRKNSVAGVSMAGAFFHSAGQLAAASVFLVSWEALRYAAPVLLVFSLLSGLATGWLATTILKKNGYNYEKA